MGIISGVAYNQDNVFAQMGLYKLGGLISFNFYKFKVALNSFPRMFINCGKKLYLNMLITI